MNHTNGAGGVAQNNNIESYVRRGIAQGKSHEEIANNLRAAGWREEMISLAFISVAENPHGLLPEGEESSRATFLYVLSFLTLYISVWAFINTSFGIIDSLFGVAMNEPALLSFRWSIAWLVVVFPVFLITNHYIPKVLPSGGETVGLSGTRKNLTYATLFLATATLIGSAVFAIFELTSGEIITPAMPKITTIALIAALLFGYYFNDLRGRKENHA
ncbi:MAG: DUF5671 domain-containing protein [Candidatus Paceibacterota bacterium]